MKSDMANNRIEFILNYILINNQSTINTLVCIINESLIYDYLRYFVLILT